MKHLILILVCWSLLCGCDHPTAVAGETYSAKVAKAFDEKIDALAFLTPGWNNDPQFPAARINAETIKFAKQVVRKMQFTSQWAVGPLPDGSVRFSSNGQSVIVSALK